MKTMVTFGVFFAAFLAGLLLVIVGAAAASLLDCPALMSQFPTPNPSCNLFAWLAFIGAPMGVVGGAVFSGIIVFGKWSDQAEEV